MVHDYKLIDLLIYKGFNFLFEKTKFYKNRICWNLVSNKNLQKQLSENIKKLAKVNATKDIVDEIVKLIKNYNPKK